MKLILTQLHFLIADFLLKSPHNNNSNLLTTITMKFRITDRKLDRIRTFVQNDPICDQTASDALRYIHFEANSKLEKINGAKK